MTEGQRYHIEALLREGFSQSYIAIQIGKNKSSVSREIRRNVTETGYCAETAHKITMERHLHKSKRGIPDETRFFVEYCLSLKLSPEQISGVGDLTGSWASPKRHYKHDTNRFPKGWRNMGDRFPGIIRMLDRIPDWMKGSILSGILGSLVVDSDC